LPDVVANASVDIEVATEDTVAAPATDGQALAAPGEASPAASGAATVAASASAAGGDGDAAWNSAPVAAALLVLGTAPVLIVLRRRAVRRHLEVSPTER
jgi:hypothetical protein